MRCNIPNGLSWSFRVIGPNLINPGLHSWKNVNNRNTNTQCRCKRPFTCSPVLAKKYMFGNDKTSFQCLYRLRKATKKYTHQSLTCCFIEWLAQPPNIHFGLQHWIFQFSPDSIYVLDYSCPHASNLFVLLTLLAK